MKKILALVLALVMTMSLATISSGAAFTDADKVQYTDAVNTMSALGVMGGYADGSVRPQADVTRGAAAKMVAMVATASNPTTIGYYAGTSSFADVPASHTFADAVAFCVARGIVDGYGDGTYGVADNVKGWAIAKMVLVAMGYDAAAYGLTGTGASLNTITLASQVGLFDGMAADFSATAAASREECAQIVYNALDNATVTALRNDTSGLVTYAVNGPAMITKYGVTPTTGQTVMAALIANAGVKITANQSNTLSAYTTDGTSNFNVETGADMLGHNVVMLKKGAAKYDANGVAYFDVYGTADLTVETSIYYGMTAAEVKSALEASGYYLPYGFSSLSFATKFTNGASSATALDVVASANTCKDGNTIGAVTLLGTKNSDGTVTPYGYVVADALYTDKVAAIGTTANAETITLASAGALQNNIVSDVVNEYAGIAVDDYVTYTVVNGCYNLVKATTVDGTVSRKEASSGANAGQLTVDGQVLYPFYGTNNAVVANDVAAGYSFVLGTTYTFYLASDGSYFAAVAKTDDTKSDILYVAGTYDVTAVDAYGDATVSTYAQCVALDGTVSSVLVGVKVGSAAQQGVTTVANGFYTFALSATAADAKLGIMTASGAPTVYNQFTAPVIADALNGEYDYDGATKAYMVLDTATKAYINANTKFIFVNGSKAAMEVKVLDGSINANVADNAKALVTKDADGNWIVKAVIAGSTYTNAGATATDYLYVADAQTTPAQVGTVKINGVDTAVYEYTVYDAATGAKKTIEATNTTLPAAGFFSYTIVEGAYTLAGSAVTEATAPAAGVYYAEAYASKFGTKITTTQLTDMEAGSAIVVDTRTASEIEASQVAALTSVDAINAAKLATVSKTATFDCFVVANTGATIIFVTAVA